MPHPRILIVEDELIVALELEDRLRRQGYGIAGVARSADEALRIADEDQLDLALLDLRLAGDRDGVDLAADLRVRGVPFVFLTAHGDEDTLARVRQVEPLGYLLKPFDERLLRLTLETALQRHAGEQARLAAIEAQQAAEASQAAILEHSPDGVLVVDRLGRIELCNRVANHMFGPTCGHASLTTLLPELSPELVAELAESRAPTQIEGRRADGSAFPAEVLCGAATIAEAERVIVIVRDVTVQRRLEEQLARARQLEVAGRVASGVAHDLNNLLSVVWMTSYLLRQASADEVVELLDDLDNAVNLGASLTTRLLSVARREHGEVRAVGVNDALATITKLARRACGGEVRVAVDFDPNAGSVWIDPAQFDQLVLNLIVNADRAMPNGGHLNLRSRVFRGSEGEQSLVLIEVEDSGVGIDPAIRARLFEPFFTTRQANGGTGLGLSIVRDIVERAEGTLELESEPGQGTVFRIYLPRHGEVVIGADAGRPSDRRVAGRGRTVLVVDDNGAHRRSLARLLATEGFRVIQARGAGEAVLIAERGEQALSLAIIDRGMPYMDGSELSARLKQREPALPIVLVSSSLVPLTPGPADAILTKPLEPDALFDTIARLLADRGSALS